MTNTTEPAAESDGYYEFHDHDDAAHLHALGYKSEFKREMSPWANFSLGFTYLSPVVGVYSVFYLGLAVIVVGVGLLKPNISAMVGSLYAGQPGAKRDAGFSIFYMGINLGAFVSPLVAGTIGEAWNWRGGFFCCGLFMLLGVFLFRFTSPWLGNAGLPPTDVEPQVRSARWRIILIGGAVIAAIVGWMFFAGGSGTTTSTTSPAWIFVLERGSLSLTSTPPPSISFCNCVRLMNVMRSVRYLSRRLSRSCLISKTTLRSDSSSPASPASESPAISPFSCFARASSTARRACSTSPTSARVRAKKSTSRRRRPPS